MEILDPGHKYALHSLDKQDGDEDILLVFVKRMGEKYPGNISEYSGTTVQEVCRALIDRLRYVDNQEPNVRNEPCVTQLELVIWQLEYRAAERKGLAYKMDDIQNGYVGIDKMPTCRHCGHIVCHEFE